MRRQTLVPILVVLALTLGALAQNGVIQGTAVDEKGNVVPDAQVNCYDLDPSKNVVEVQSGAPASVTTDKDGRFLIEHVMAAHRYGIVAQKAEAGYPDMSIGFYNPTGKLQTATARAKGQASDVTVRMGPKATRLEWDVKDVTTGEPIKGINYAMHRMDGGGESAGLAAVGGSAPGRYNWLIPSDIPVTIEFSAPGYQTWYYPGTTNKIAKTFMATAPGQATKLDVFLQPAVQQAGQMK
jgi:hypothetical protein